MPESTEQRRIERKERRHARARDALVDAARGILSAEGVAGFTVKAVAEAADVSKPAFYYYFPSREHLVAELADGILAREAATLVEAGLRATDPAQAVEDVLVALVAFYADDLDAFRMVYLWPQVIGTPPGFHSEVLGPRRRQAQDVLTDRIATQTRPDAAATLAGIVLATGHGILALGSLEGRDDLVQGARAAGAALARSLRA